MVGPEAPKGQRNILGVIGKVGVEIGKKVIEIEVKNIKKTDKKQHITKSTIQRDVITRFTGMATEKYNAI